MKFLFIHNGKVDDSYLVEGIEKYEKRLKHYISSETIYLPVVKNLSTIDEQKNKEAQLIQQKLQAGDYIILLDENGKEYSSVEFSSFIQKQMVQTHKRIVFISGGPYGFSDQIYAMAHHKISLSRMTFSHQMVRLFFIEQIYRAMTIMKGEPYHHL